MSNSVPGPAGDARLRITDQLEVVADPASPTALVELVIEHDARWPGYPLREDSRQWLSVVLGARAARILTEPGARRHETVPAGGNPKVLHDVLRLAALETARRVDGRDNHDNPWWGAEALPLTIRTGIPVRSADLAAALVAAGTVTPSRASGFGGALATEVDAVLSAAALLVPSDPRPGAALSLLRRHGTGRAAQPDPSPPRNDVAVAGSRELALRSPHELEVPQVHSLVGMAVPTGIVDLWAGLTIDRAPGDDNDHTMRVVAEVALRPGRGAPGRSPLYARCYDPATQEVVAVEPFTPTVRTGADPDGSPFRLTAELVIPADPSLTFDVTDRPGSPPPAPGDAIARRASAYGWDAAREEQLGRWGRAAIRWASCASLWALVDERRRICALRNGSACLVRAGDHEAGTAMAERVAMLGGLPPSGRPDVTPFLGDLLG